MDPTTHSCVSLQGCEAGHTSVREGHALKILEEIMQEAFQFKSEEISETF